MDKRNSLEIVKQEYIKTDLARKLFSKLQALYNHDYFAVGVVSLCETDNNIQKMLDFIEAKNPTMNETLFYTDGFDKERNKDEARR